MHKKAIRQEKHQRIQSSDSQPVLLGIPSLHLDHDSGQPERIGEILGMKPNHALRAVKDCSGRLYRQVAQKLSSENTARLNKFETDVVHATLLISHSGLRGKLLLEHAMSAIQSPARAERIPVLEYALLKQWNPELGGLHRGEHIVLSARQTDAASHDHLDQAHELLFASCIPLVHRHFDSLHASGVNLRRLSISFNRIACDVISALDGWEALDTAGQARLAGAAFAIASILQTPDLLKLYLGLQPQLGTYYQGVDGLLQTDVGPWDGSVWPESLKRGDAQLLTRMAQLSVLQNVFMRDWDLSALARMRDLITACEQTVYESASRSAQKMAATAQDLTAMVEHLLEMLSVTGRPFSFQQVLKRLSAWQAILTDERISALGSNSVALLDQAAREGDLISAAASGLCQKFEVISDHQQAIVRGELTWQEQCEHMGALNVQLDQLVQAGKDLDVLCQNDPLPDLNALHELVVQHEARDERNNALEETRQEIARQGQQIDLLTDEKADLEARLSGLDSENDRLRQENADLRLRNAHLQEVLNNGTRAADAEAASEEVCALLEQLIEGPDAVAALRLLEFRYGNRVRMLDSVYETAERYKSSIPVSALYHRIKTLAIDGVDLLREGARMIDLRDVVPGDLSVQESETVKKNAKLRARRTFRDGQNQRQIYTHLNLDYSHRLYFDFDVEEGRVLLAYAGKHLPSARHATV